MKIALIGVEIGSLKMTKLFVTAVMLFSINSFAKICPDVSGIYKSGNEYPCLTWSEDNSHGPYKCEKYNIITQSDCDKLTFFEKEVVVNPDSNIMAYISAVKRLRPSNFVNISFLNPYGANHELHIGKDYFPPSDGSGYCYTNRVKGKADGTDGQLVTVFNCGGGTFTETLIRAGSNLSISQRTDIRENNEDRPVLGPWQPWTVFADMPRVAAFPANTLLSDGSSGNFSGALNLEFIWNDWRVGQGYSYASKDWYNLNEEKIKKTLSLLNKKIKYRCSIKAMVSDPGSMHGGRPSTLLVESLENCMAL